MIDTDEKWVLEYSAVSKMNGQYPFHIDLLSHAGRPPHHWRIMFVGTHEQVCKKHEQMAKKLKVWR